MRVRVKGSADLVAPPDWEDVVATLRAFGIAYNRVKSWSGLTGKEALKVLTNDRDLIRAFVVRGPPVDLLSPTNPVRRWVFLNFVRNQVGREFLFDPEIRYREEFEVLDFAVRHRDLEILKDGKVIQAAIATLGEFVDVLNGLVVQAAPKTLRYHGYIVENPYRLPDSKVRSLLSGIAPIEQIFRRRGMDPALKLAIRRVVVQNKQPDETGDASYDPKTATIVLTDKMLTTPFGRFLKEDWIEEVFLHEFGHHVHLWYMAADARAVWNAAWEPINRESKITGKDRKRWFEMLRETGFSPSKVARKLKGKDRLFFAIWLREPLVGSPLITPKNIRVTKRGQRVFAYFANPDEAIARELSDYDEDYAQDPNVRERMRKRIKGRYLRMLGLDDDQPQHVSPDVVKQVRSEMAAELGVPSDYAKTDEREDFAETFVGFMTKPEQLTPTARFRMKQALALSGLYGKPIMRVGGQPSK